MIGDQKIPMPFGLKETSRQKIESELNNAGSTSIINLVNHLIELAYNLEASDIHIDPQLNFLRIRLRIDGVLQDEIPFPKFIHSEIISRIKILASLRTDEHQSAQDGRFCVNLENETLDIRVSIIPTYHGENAVLRLLTDRREDFNLDRLGFSQENKEKILQAIKRPCGMILVTGPTGSGKTTTLYTLIKMLNSPGSSIITIEDPIEYSIAGINQIGVNSRTGLNFANGLKAILRQDPDIIMVGEIRDQETAGLAINTALTGHLVLSTMHTNDALATLPRLIDLKIEPYLIASTVSIAISQRLVRKICQSCKIKIKMMNSELGDFKEALPFGIKEKENIFYKGSGCKECNNTGYKGRVSINEVLVVDNQIRNSIHNKVNADQFRKAAQSKMTFMIEDGFKRASLGITTIEEILRTLHE